jgi:hypothetical protein
MARRHRSFSGVWTLRRHGAHVPVRFALLLAALCVALPDRSSADEETAAPPPWLGARLSAAGWLASLEGYLQTPRGGGAGTTTPSRPTIEEIGLGGLRVLPALDAALLVRGSHELRFDYVHIDIEGSDTLEEPLISQDVFFPAGSSVRSRLGLPMLRLGYRAHWLPLHRGGWSLAPEVGVAVAFFRYELTSPSASGDVDRSYSVAFPYFGLGLSGPLAQRLQLEVDVQGSGIEADYVDAEARLVYELLRWRRTRTSATLGLRGTWLHRVDSQREEQNDVNVRVGAFSTDPWAGLTFGLRIEL